MTKKLLFLPAVLLIIGGSVLGYAFAHSPVTARQQPTVLVKTPSKPAPTVSVGVSVVVTKVGTISCLRGSASGTSKGGAQNTNCATGLIQADGTSYALIADDPTVTGSLPTGQKVQVTGTLTTQTTAYNTIGIIHVQSIQKL